MSRYQFPGKEQRYRIVVGWDSSLASFFGQVEDLAWETGGRIVDEHATIGDRPDEGLLVWVGAASPIEDVKQLVDAIAPYSSITEDLLRRLRQDQRAKKPLAKAHVPPGMIRTAGKGYLQERKK